MKLKQLNHVAIHVQDVDRSCRFYEAALRLEQLPRPAFSFLGAWFLLGDDQELHLVGERTEPVQSRVRGTHFALLVDDLDAWEEHLRQQGIAYLPRRRRPDGALQIYLTDPDGHVVELCTPPEQAAT